VSPRRLRCRAPAGAGSYPNHLPTDFIDARASAISELYTSLSSPQAAVHRRENEAIEWNTVFQFVSICRKPISAVSVIYYFVHYLTE
jgi:hypothetical protein